MLSWQLSLGKIDWVSRRGLFFSDVSVMTTWGQVCSPTPSSQKYFATPQKNRCRTKPITCIWPLPFLCHDESGTTVWLCQPLGFQRESQGQVPSTRKFPSQLGGVTGIVERAGSLLGNPRQSRPQQSPTSHIVF